MKHKIINTNKADILVIELPEEATNAHLSSQGRCRLYYETSKTKDLTRYDELIVNIMWQPLIFNEITAEKIVDKQIIEGVSLYPVSSERYFMTALESLQSLIEVNVQKVNPYQDDWDELCTWGHGGFAKDGKTELELYSEAEKSVFRNPYYFYKLK